MILKIAGRNKQGRLVAKELSGITFVTMGTNPEGKPALEYGSSDGFAHQEDVEGVLWEVCEEEAVIKDDKVYQPAEPDTKAEHKKSVLTRKNRVDAKLEENIRNMDEKLKQADAGAQADSDSEEDDRDWEKTDDVMEM